MKRILFFSHAMELGGAERVLLGLLEAMDTSQYQVDLFLMRHTGELMREVPAGVRLLPERPEYASLAVPIGDVLKKRQFGVAMGRLAGKLRAKRRVKCLGITGENDVGLLYSHRCTARFMPTVGEGTYDLAVSFLTPHYFVTEKVKARKKIAWIHTDYARLAVDRESQLEMWRPYDRIVSISPQVSRGFAGMFPELRNKLVEIEHMLPVDAIRRQAVGDVADEMPVNGAIRLLSVGRFTNAKNFDNVPDICARICRTGLNVKWYLIGYGGDEALIRRKITEAGMEDHVIILGKRANPYPYMASCDLYVQPSRYEGKCVSVLEAQILKKPVVITAYPTSASQMENGVDGIVVPQDNEGCAAGIAALLRDQERMEDLRQNCAARDYSNREEIRKLYEMM